MVGFIIEFLMGTFYFYIFIYIYFFSLNLRSITLFGHMDNRFLLRKIQKNPILFRVRKEADGPKNRVPEPILVKQIPTHYYYYLSLEKQIGGSGLCGW